MNYPTICLKVPKQCVRYWLDLRVISGWKNRVILPTNMYYIDSNNKKLYLLSGEDTFETKSYNVTILNDDQVVYVILNRLHEFYIELQYDDGRKITEVHGRRPYARPAFKHFGGNRLGSKAKNTMRKRYK